MARTRGPGAVSISREPSRSASEEMVGGSDSLREALRLAQLAAPLGVTVLLTGPSGSGKSRLARAMHEQGSRRDSCFVEINCAALPEALIESELFGAAAGGHSTAHRSIPGKIAAAEGGTLLLDEIGELPLVAQAKLLQLLQSKLYYPLGSAKARRADVRLICATNSDLIEAVAEKRFREDLFYRLDIFRIRLPSLAERGEDIGELADVFCRRAADHHGLRRLRFSQAARYALRSTDWPGNVRQLGNTVEAALIRANGEGAEQIECCHLFPGRASGATLHPVEQNESFQEATRRFQRDLLQHNLELSCWNVSETARRLGLARSHVYNLIHAFGLERTQTA